jgi:di/tricarboxylate transporter
VTAALFLRGRFRHDLVAIAALVASVAVGLVPGETAFAGFPEPAVVTAAAMSTTSRGLEDSGAIDRLARLVSPERTRFATVPVVPCALVAGLSAFDER